MVLYETVKLIEINRVFLPAGTKLRVKHLITGQYRLYYGGTAIGSISHNILTKYFKQVTSK